MNYRIEELKNCLLSWKVRTRKYMPCERKTEEMLGQENQIKTKSAVVIAGVYMLKVDNNVRLMEKSVDPLAS